MRDGSNLIEFNYFPFQVLKLFGNFVHGKSLDLKLVECLQLFEFAHFIQCNSLIHACTEEISIQIGVSKKLAGIRYQRFSSLESYQIVRKSIKLSILLIFTQQQLWLWWLLISENLCRLFRTSFVMPWDQKTFITRPMNFLEWAELMETIVNLLSLIISHLKYVEQLTWATRQPMLRRSNRILEHDLKKDFITDNYGLVGIIFRAIIVLEHVRKHNEHLASDHVMELFDLEIMRRTRTVLLQVYTRRYNVRLMTGQRTRTFRQVFKVILQSPFLIASHALFLIRIWK